MRGDDIRDQKSGPGLLLTRAAIGARTLPLTINITKPIGP